MSMSARQLAPLDEDLPLRLDGTAAEKRVIAALAELYGILRATEHLETAYIRDLVAPELYKSNCNKLIGQFKLQLDELKSMGAVQTIEGFMQSYDVKLGLAYKRLVLDGAPATAMERSSDTRNDALLAFDTSSSIITALDFIKVDMVSMDTIVPAIGAVAEMFNKHPGLPADFEPKNKLQAWLRTLQAKPASYTLSGDESRQLAYDLDTAHADFQRFLRGGK